MAQNYGDFTVISSWSHYLFTIISLKFHCDFTVIPKPRGTSMLCVRCRFRVKEYIPPASEEDEIISSQISIESLSISAEICTQGGSLSRTVSNFSDNLCDYNDHSLERFLKIPLIEKDRLYSEKNHGVKKLDESYAALENKFQSQFGIVPESTYRKINQDHCSMIAKVKKLYNAESDKSIKKKLLSILSDSWEVSRIASEFSCSRKMVLNLKNDISESENVDLDSGEMTTNTLNPTKVSGNQLLKLDVKKLVIDFYESEENSKQLAGMKDFKSVKDCDGNRTTHVVCVCTIHQNVQLMLEGCNFPKFAKNTDWVVESQPIYKNLLNKLVCSNPKES
ncbi:uncharacterized protein LOC123267767 [Cotesia glomerata]|uniref:uncharacterized protein LOC123267767 n=1 Tax=Cotesia glomerata TaxID=32391 RepID=UPI001D016083|nr:uncharacterized protein LOC123267767 [Cotesia glomerata]